jgi:hypothetical protein
MLRKATGGGCPEQENAVLRTPLHETVALVPRQIVQDEQHAHWWEKAIQLLGGRIDVPVLPASSLRHHFWGCRTLLEDGFQLTFEPGMQHRIRAVLHCLGTDFTSRGSQQGEQFGRLASHILVRPTRGLTFGLPRGARLRDTLIGTAFIFAPQLQAEPLGDHIGALNHRFFSCV